MSSKNNSLTLTFDYVTLNRNFLLPRTNHSCIFSNSNIKCMFTSEPKMLCIRTSSLTLTARPKINNDYLLPNSNQCTKFGN